MSELATDHLVDGKYKIVRLVGQGGWATVYEAVNLRIQRRVAIKLLNAALADKPELATRFAREAEAATQIESPFVVTVFDAGTLPDGRPYIVMEFLEGESLGAVIERRGPLSEEEAAGYAVHLLSGLADAHETGVLHRDIKPDNLVIVRTKHGDEILKLVDFGISKPNVARPELLAMTQTDLVLGSPVYMSPEQARGTRHMDHRSDLYSVGVVLYEALTRELPHASDNFNDLMFKVALEDAPDPRTKRPDLDPAMAEMIMKALAREPAARFQSAVEFRDAISAWLEQRGAPQPASAHVTSKFRVRKSAGTPALANGSIDAMPAGLVESGIERRALTTPAPETPKRKAPIAIAAGVLLLAGAGAFIALRPSSKTESPASPPATTAVSPRAAQPAPSATVPATAAPPATLSPETTSSVGPAVPTPAVKAGGPVSHAPKRPATTAPVAPPSASAAAPAASPASSTVVEGRTVRTTF